MKRQIIFVLLILFLIPSISGAAPIYDTITDYTPDGRDLYLNSANTTTSIGQKFTTDSNSYIISSVTLNMIQLADGDASLSIYIDDGNELGIKIGELTSHDLFSSKVDGYGLTTFGGNDIRLAADTSYWALLSVTKGDSAAPKIFDWAFADRSWNLSGDYASYTGEYLDVDTGSPLMMIVEANPVPEPCTMLLLGSGLVGLAGFKRRKMKK